MQSPLARDRVAIAVGALAFGCGLSLLIRHLLVFAHTSPARLGIEMMRIEIVLVAVAICGAYLLPGPVTHRLGLGPSRLPIGAVIALTLGTLGISHAIDA